MGMNFQAAAPWLVLAVIILALYIYVRSRRTGRK